MSDQPQTLPPLPFVCPLCLWSWASEEGLRAHIPASHNTTLDRFDAVMEDPTNAINYHVGVNERLTAEVERLTQELDNARALVLADQGVLVDAPALAVGERLRAERAEAERDALAAQGASLREALEAVKEIIGPAYAWAEIDRERDDTDWQACERAEKLMYAALAAASEGEG